MPTVSRDRLTPHEPHSLLSADVIPAPATPGPGPSRATFEAANVAAEHRLAALSKLLDVALQLATEQETQKILQLVTSGVCDAADCERASLYLYDESRNELFTHVVTELELNEIRIPLNKGVTGWVARHRQLACVDHPHEDSRWDGSIDRRTGFLTRNLLAVPVLSSGGDRLLGVLQVLNKNQDTFNGFDEHLLQAFGAHAASALERGRLLEEARRSHELQHALEMGRRIQLGFLPQSLPQIPGYDLSVWWQPAEFVSGDYYDWFGLSDEHLGLAVGDVSGHGLGPSLIMASLRAMVHVLAQTMTDPDRMLRLLDETIAPDLQDSRFVTFLLLSLDPRDHTFRFANAGHGPAFHYRYADRSFRRLEATRMPLGFPHLRVAASGVHRGQLEPGDVLLLGTDGVVEVTNPSGELFTTERLKLLVDRHRELSAEELIANISDEVNRFHQKDQPLDDSTLLILQRRR